VFDAFVSLVVMFQLFMVAFKRVWLPAWLVVLYLVGYQTSMLACWSGA